MLRNEDVAKFVKEISDLTNNFVDKVYKLIEMNNKISQIIVESRNLEEENKFLQSEIDRLMKENESIRRDYRELSHNLSEYKQKSKELISEVQEASKIEDEKTSRILDGLKKIIESEVKIR